MEGGKTTEQDIAEFDMLLGEIPDATYENPHGAPHHITANNSSVLETLKHIPSPRSAKIGEVMFSRGLSFAKNRADQQIQSNGRLDDTITGYETNALNFVQHELSLPDDKSLTLAFEEFSIKDNMSLPKLNAASVVKHDIISPSNDFLKNSQSLLGIDALQTSLPLHQSMNGFKIDNQDNLNISEYNELKKQNSEILACDFTDQRQCLPAYNGAMPLNDRAYAYQLLPNVPVSGIELTSPRYQHQFFVDAQVPSILPNQHLGHFLDAQVPSILPNHHLGQSNITCENLEEESYYRLQQQFLYQQQLQNLGADLIQFQKSVNTTINPSSGSQVQPQYCDVPSNPDSCWNDNPVYSRYNHLDLSEIGIDLHQFHHPTSRGRVGSYEFLHRHQACTANNFLAHHHFLEKAVKESFPEKILTRSHGMNSLRSLRSNSITNSPSALFANNNRALISNGHSHQLSFVNDRSLYSDGQNSRGSSIDSSDFLHASKSIQLKYNSVDEVRGRIYSLAKDQHGCRFLQKKFTEGSVEDIGKIFIEIIGHIVELMTDPFGNYLIQKLLEVCNEDQRMKILHAVTREAGVLIRIACNMHGTRAVQKVIETLQTPEQIYMVISSLKPGIVLLMKDTNGNHVAQRCLQCFSAQQSEFLYDAAISRCVEIATDRQGCCVIQKCVSHSYGDQKNRLMSEISSYSLVLSQDPYGNYVVQYILEQEIPWVATSVLQQLAGNYGYLSRQKHSSNVVEKCLKHAREEDRVKIIQEMINSPQFLEMLQDPYGNFVMQTALKQSKGSIKAAFLAAIEPHVPVLRNNPYGKRVLLTASQRK